MTAVSVTAEHIADGTPGSGYGCALALAFKSLPGVEDASIGQVTANLLVVGDEGEDWVYLDLPDEACEFVTAYDSARPVEPFIFAVDYPEPQP